MIEIRVDEQQAEQTSLGMAEQVRLAHFRPDNMCDLLDGRIVGRHHPARPLPSRVEDDEREEVLAAGGAAELALEDELEDVRGKQFRPLVAVQSAVHVEALSKPLSLIL